MEQLTTRKIAHRYAKALLDAADEAGMLDTVSQAMGAIQRLLLDVPELPRFFTNPAIPHAEKTALLQNQFCPGLPPVVGNLLTILADNDRLAMLPEILETFPALVNEKNGIVQAEVTTPIALDHALEEKFKQNLEQLFGYRQVDLSVTIDPAILAGAIVKIGDKLIDGSYRGKLDQLRKQVG